MEPVSTGMGQGAAQVFSPSRAVFAYARAAQQNMLVAQRERAELGKMMNDLSAETSKMRAEDIPDFYKSYNELKDIYSSNKGLYTNPAKYPEAYKRAGELQANLRQQLGESIQQKQNFASAITQYDANRDLFDDDTVNLLKSTMGMSTKKIKDTLGGSLFDRNHINYNPKPLDWDKIGKGLKDFAEASGGATDFFENVQNAPGVPKGYVASTQVRKYAPGAIMDYTNRLLDNPADSSFRKNMAKEYSYTTEAELDNMSMKASEFLGRDLGKIQNHEQYAKVKMLLSYKEERGEPKLINDQAWDEANKRSAEARAWGRQLSLFERSEAGKNARANKVSGALGKRGLEDVATDMAKAFDGKDVNTVIGEVQEPLLKFTAASGGKPAVASPKNLIEQSRSKKGLVGQAAVDNALAVYMKEVETAFANPGTGTYAPRKTSSGALDKAYYKKMFLENKPLMFIPIEYEEADPNDNTKKVKKQRIGIIGDEANTKVRAAKLFNVLKKSGAPAGEKKTNEAFTDVDLFE